MQKEEKGDSEPMKPEDKSSAKNPTKATVIQFAGCHDTQTSADASIGGHASGLSYLFLFSGAMSWGLLKVLHKEHGTITYLDVLKETRVLLEGKYSQIPQVCLYLC
jgi:hypothetical protein